MQKIGVVFMSRKIAIVGIACKFPKANNHNEYWNNMINEVDCVEHIPKSRWSWQDYRGNPEEDINKTRSHWMGSINEVERFDPEFFNISHRESEEMDPQQRIMLELAWSCLEDSGTVPMDLSGSKLGVFVGASNFDYKELQDKFDQVVEGHRASGTVNTMIPNRISYFLNTQGPSLLVDTACSTSLVCLHQAINSIRNGESDSALAGAINILLSPARFISFSKTGMLSPTGRCKSFDQSADGYVRGEGAAFVYLKSLDKAIEDKNPIYGVIEGSAINHGGHARTLTSPNALTQSKVIIAALENANVLPEDISYIETHGTGTPLGDPIEILGLKRALDKNGNAQCGSKIKTRALGSAKSYIGHLEASAGMAGLIKVLMSMKHCYIPKILHNDNLNKRIEFEKTSFYVPQQALVWKSEKTRIAGISSFGFGGVNSHVIVSGYQESDNLLDKSISRLNNKYPVIFSAKSKASLFRSYTNFIDFLTRNNHIRLEDISYTTCVGRQRFNFTKILHCKTVRELVDQLKSFSIDDTYELESTPPNSKLSGVAFLYSGQGSQFSGMGKQLYQEEPIFRKHIDECEKLFFDATQQSLTKLLWHSKENEIDQTQYTQPSLFSFEYALAKLWISKGIFPSIQIGHSVGEYVAACIGGAMSLKDALNLVSERGRLMASLCSSGGMISIQVNVNDIEKIAGDHIKKGKLFIAGINSPTQTVLSGCHESINEIASTLDQKSIRYKNLDVSHAFHSGMMDAMLDDFRAYAENINFSTIKIPILSNLTGHLLEGDAYSAQYWVDHTRNAVLFSEGITKTAKFAKTMIEIGPKPVLVGLGQQVLDDSSVLWLHSIQKDKDEITSFYNSLDKIYSTRKDPHWNALFDLDRCRKISIPTYSFERNIYWINRRVSAEKYETDFNLKELDILSQYDEGISTEELSLSYNNLEKNALDMVVLVYKELGLFSTKNNDVLVSEARRRLNISHNFTRLFEAHLNILAKNNFIDISKNRLCILRKPNLIETWKEVAVRNTSLKETFPWLKALCDLIYISLSNTAKIMREEINPTEVLFPEGSMKLVENIYKNNPLSNYYNRQVCSCVEQLVNQRKLQGRTIRILEIGAGTGGTTQNVLQRLSDSMANIEYTYTDVSNVFIEFGRHNYGSQYAFMEFRELDIEKRPSSQGFDAAHYDIVLGANVVHATEEIWHTLNNIKYLLKPGGALVLNEVDKDHLYLTTTFGLLDGWWNFRDTNERIKFSPLLTSRKWIETLSKSGFNQVKKIENESSITEVQSQSVILGVSDGYINIMEYDPYIDQRLLNEGALISYDEKSIVEEPEMVNEFNIKQLLSKTPMEIRSDLSDFIKKMIAKVTGRNPNEFEDLSVSKSSFSSLGVDSMIGMELRRHVQRHLNLDVPLQMFINQSTVQDVVNQLYHLIIQENIVESNKNVIDEQSDLDKEVIII